MEKKNPTNTELLTISIKTLADILNPRPFGFLNLLNKKEKKSIEEKKVELIRKLVESGVDPSLFDSLLSNEMNRRLKVRFGVIFIILTIIFTSASYSIVVLDAIYKWDISEIAITALIIEIPIQFIGIMYIIARNLFPTKKE